MQIYHWSTEQEMSGWSRPLTVFQGMFRYTRYHQLFHGFLVFLYEIHNLSSVAECLILPTRLAYFHLNQVVWLYCRSIAPIFTGGLIQKRGTRSIHCFYTIQFQCIVEQPPCPYCWLFTHSKFAVWLQHIDSPSNGENSRVVQSLRVCNQPWHHFCAIFLENGFSSKNQGSSYSLLAMGSTLC